MVTETRRRFRGRTALGILAAGAALSLTACGPLPLLPPALSGEGEATVSPEPEPTEAAEPEPEPRATITSEPDPTETADDAETVGVFDLDVGDCFIESEMDSALGGDEVTGIPLVDCSEPHDSEFFLSHDMPEGEFPGTEAINEEASELCKGDAFTDFVGLPWAESALYAYPLSPTEETWNQLDDREILCYVIDPDQMVTGTLEGAEY